MFRIEYLRTFNHPQLGSIELFLSDIEEINNASKPYTSVIIGPNGTGKSFILRAISDILTQFNIFKSSGIRKFNLPFGFHIRYKLEKDTFEIISHLEILNKVKEKKVFLFYKNRPFEVRHVTIKNTNIFKPFESKIKDVLFPNHVIVNSVMLNDRFLFKKSLQNDFYQYLGVRSTSSTASTKSAVKGLINKLFNESINNVDFLINLKDLLGFLEFENKFEVEYNTKLHKLFFTGNLTVKDFKQYYEFWWDEKFIYSKRAKNNPIWSKPFYDNYYKNNEIKIEGLVRLLNEISTSGKLVHKYKSTSKLLKVDFIGSKIDESEIWQIVDLEKLDIINVNGINLNKNNSSMNISDISSGEYHLLISLIGIFSKIKENSLVLIDEPEISLHPNWQMQYITFLKNVFSKYSSCQFILTTHSHFLVSDLEGESSSVTALNRNLATNLLDSKLLDINTFGWSAEDVLYNIFNVRSSLNYFLQADLTELLGIISNNLNEVEKIENILKKLNQLPKRDNDPLQEIIIEATAYLKEIK